MGTFIKHKQMYRPELFNRKGKFITVSGIEIDFNDFSEHDVSLFDVAQGLAMTCRSGGQLKEYFSVAQHAVCVAEYLQVQGYPPEVVFQGLHHDDSEAYLGDVISPLKSLLPGYVKLENKFQKTICNALGVKYPFDKAVHLADRAMFAREVMDTKWPGANGEILTIPLSPEDAKRAYLDYHNALLKLMGRDH